MGQKILGRVRGDSVKEIRKVSMLDLIDTYEVILDNDTSAGEFTVTNGATGQTGPTGPMGAKITSVELIGQDAAGGNRYKLNMDNGDVFEFIAPRGERGQDLTPTQLEAANSGITASKVSTYDGLQASKQDKLVSGQNIKTIGNASLLGAGNLTVQNIGAASASHSHAVSSITVPTYNDMKSYVNKIIDSVTLWDGVGQSSQLLDPIPNQLKNKDSNGTATLIVTTAYDESAGKKRLATFIVSVVFFDGLETHIGFQGVSTRLNSVPSEYPETTVGLFSSGDVLSVSHRSDNRIMLESKKGRILDVKALINEGGKIR